MTLGGVVVVLGAGRLAGLDCFAALLLAKREDCRAWREVPGVQRLGGSLALPKLCVVHAGLVIGF